jgi:DNA-binding response OmpR family regulator
VRVAGDGDEAAHLLSTIGDEVDLVLLDLTMPGRGGEELWNWLRSRWPDLPVLFMSGWERPPFTEGARADFLAKPFRIDELRKKVTQLLGGGPPG